MYIRLSVKNFNKTITLITTMNMVHFNQSKNGICTTDNQLIKEFQAKSIMSINQEV